MVFRLKVSFFLLAVSIGLSDPAFSIADEASMELSKLDSNGRFNAFYGCSPHLEAITLRRAAARNHTLCWGAGLSKKRVDSAKSFFSKTYEAFGAAGSKIMSFRQEVGSKIMSFRQGVSPSVFELSQSLSQLSERVSVLSNKFSEFSNIGPKLKQERESFYKDVSQASQEVDTLLLDTHLKMKAQREEMYNKRPFKSQSRKDVAPGLHQYLKLDQSVFRKSDPSSLSHADRAKYDQIIASDLSKVSKEKDAPYSKRLELDLDSEDFRVRQGNQKIQPDLISPITQDTHFVLPLRSEEIPDDFSLQRDSLLKIHSTIETKSQRLAEQRQQFAQRKSSVLKKGESPNFGREETKSNKHHQRRNSFTSGLLPKVVIESATTRPVITGVQRLLDHSKNSFNKNLEEFIQEQKTFEDSLSAKPLNLKQKGPELSFKPFTLEESPVFKNTASSLKTNAQNPSRQSFFEQITQNDLHYSFHKDFQGTQFPQVSGMINPSLQQETQIVSFTSKYKTPLNSETDFRSQMHENSWKLNIGGFAKMVFSNVVQMAQRGAFLRFSTTFTRESLLGLGVTPDCADISSFFINLPFQHLGLWTAAVTIPAFLIEKGDGVPICLGNMWATYNKMSISSLGLAGGVQSITKPIFRGLKSLLTGGSLEDSELYHAYHAAKVYLTLKLPYSLVTASQDALDYLTSWLSPDSWKNFAIRTYTFYNKDLYAWVKSWFDKEMWRKWLVKIREAKEARQLSETDVAYDKPKPLSCAQCYADAFGEWIIYKRFYPE